MAMMAKMRSLAPAFIITVGALFVLFMVITDSNVLEAVGGPTNSIGSVNGEEITRQEFQSAYDQQVDNQRKQSGKELEETQIDQIRDQVWDAIITQKLFEQKIKELGIKVSDDEIKNVILGDNPPDFLKQSFIDSLGNFNRQLYEQAIFDPQNNQALLQAEELVRQSLLTQKLQSMVLASVTVGEDEVRRKFAEQNISAQADYALIDLNLIPDSLVELSDADIKAYYDKNLNNFKLPPQRKLKYVLFPNVPSREDTLSVIKGLQSIKNTITDDTLEFKQLISIYSEVPYSRDTIGVNQLSADEVAALSNAKAGDIIGPVADQRGYALIKFFGSINSGDPIARASHILINQQGSDEKNLEEANKLYQRLIAGENFAALAKEFSADPGSAINGGDLGYFGKGMMIKEFEDAVFSGKIGEVQKPVKTTYGYHIIKVTDRTNKKYIVEKLINQVKQSATSRDRNFNQANDFSYLANKNDFEKEAELVNYKIQETPLFAEQPGTVPGLGANKRLVAFAFENSVNSISEPFKVQAGYVVVKITESYGERFRPFDEVKEQLKPQVRREKKMERLEKIANNIYSKINGDLSKVPDVDPRIKIQQTGSFTSQTSIPGVGRDNAFISTAMETEMNKVTKPVKGLRGYFLIKVNQRSEFDKKAYDEQSSNIRNTLLQEKRNRYLNQWVTDLRENADITDNRYRFYGQ